MLDRVNIVIPARYNSSRLPGKPLLDLLGKPMIQHVYEKAAQVTGVSAVMVATDDERIFTAVENFGGKAVMTSPNHPSGTDRLVEVMSQCDGDVFINVQGDEPLVRPSDLQQLVDHMLEHPQLSAATLSHAIDAEEAKNPNTVKVVTTHHQQALYFSRSPIPFPRRQECATYQKHIGVYAYRRELLERYAQLPNSNLEGAESLEQLRILQAGYAMGVLDVPETGPGVDTPECLARVRRILSGEPDEPVNPLSNIRLVITDVDGVLTDGSIFYDPNGECIKRFHVRDGLGIRMLEESGIKVAVLSGRDSETLRTRVADLGISHAQFGVKDKAQACRELMAEAGVAANETLCTGDDTIDLPAFSVCGMSAAVADAPMYIQNQATMVLQTAGGQGALREVSDAILTAQGKQAVFETSDGFLQAMKKVTQ